MNTSVIFVESRFLGRRIVKNISGMRISKNINLFLQNSALQWESEESFIDGMTLFSQEAEKTVNRNQNKKVECAETFKVVRERSSGRNIFEAEKSIINVDKEGNDTNTNTGLKWNLFVTNGNICGYFHTCLVFTTCMW